MLLKIGFGGGCHWCTEAVFQTLKGVHKVEQGFIAPANDGNTFSEAIIVHYNPMEISLFVLVEIHLYTHRSTSMHSMRSKYRSAVYLFNEEDLVSANNALTKLQRNFKAPLVTTTFSFGAFRPSLPKYQDYYYKNPEKPFCSTYIDPKMKVLLLKFKKQVKEEKISFLHESSLEK